MLLYVHRDRADYWGRGTQDGYLDFHTAHAVNQDGYVRANLVTEQITRPTTHTWRTRSVPVLPAYIQYLHACQVRVTVSDSGLSCASVTSFEL